MCDAWTLCDGLFSINQSGSLFCRIYTSPACTPSIAFKSEDYNIYLKPNPTKKCYHRPENYSFPTIVANC